MRSTGRARWAVPLLVTVLASGCGTAPTPTPTPTPTEAPTPTPVAYADTLRIGVPLGGSWRLGEDWSRGWNWVIEGTGWPGLSFGRLVYSGLYRYDGREDAVPDLADGPCFVPGADGKVIRCRLVDTTFHDGTPLTADDVAYTYQVFSSPVLTWGMPTEVRVVDPRTVDFVLAKVDPTFPTTVLPIIPVFSRHSIEAAVAAFDEATKGLSVEGLDALAADIDAEISADPPVCSEARVAQVDAIYRKLGFPLYHEDALDESGTFDACRWLDYAALDHLDNSDHFSIGFPLTQAGIDRVAGIVAVMAMGRPDLFVGTGPYRYVSQDAEAVHFEAFPGYHGGVAATRYIDFVRSADVGPHARGDGSDLAAGAVDIVQNARLGTGFEETAAAHGVRVIRPPVPNFLILTFNVREGRIFSDVNLRRALQLCIDLPRNVDAVTSGAGIPIYSPVLPGTWAYDPDLPKPERDVAAAKDLIEASGWQLGSDGVYAKGNERLAAEVPARGDDPARVKMADLIAAQARDCGMDLRSKPVSWDQQLGLFQYPHHLPGTETPFDLTIVQYFGCGDPACGPLLNYDSSQISDAEHPDAANVGGFGDPALDRLIADASATYDQADRARLLREAQEELAAQLPAIFLWTGTGYDAVRSAVTTVDGPLDLTVPNWAWQPERMVVVKSGS